MMERNEKPYWGESPSVNQVIEVTARYFDTTPEAMKGLRKARRVQEARWMASYICCSLLAGYRFELVKKHQGKHGGLWLAARVIHNKTHAEIAEALDKDETSIDYYYKQAVRLLDEDAKFEMKLEAILMDLDGELGAGMTSVWHSKKDATPPRP